MYTLSENFYKVSSSIETIRGDIITMGSSDQNGKNIRLELIEKKAGNSQVLYRGMLNNDEYKELLATLIMHKAH